MAKFGNGTVFYRFTLNKRGNAGSNPAPATLKQSHMQKEVSTEVIKNLDSNVVAVIGAKNIEGFEKAFLVSDAIGKLKELLTPTYMKPIMNLQGNALGFKTDKDKNGGYDEATVKNCLIEAVLIGVQPVGNQFNIIAGNMYPTKQGFKYLLDNIKGLEYTVTKQLPRIKPDNSGAAVVCDIEWSLNKGEKQTKSIDFPIKMNQYMGADGVLGKADRKAFAWLYNKINGTEIPDGDVQDVEGRVVSSNIHEKPSEEEIELKRWKALFDDCKTPAELLKYKEQPMSEKARELYEEKLSTFLD